jgi:hypothetical protein
MTSPTDNILTAVGRQLSDHYLPTVQEPLPSELRDLVVQLVALETRARGSSARTSAASQFVTIPQAPDLGYTDPSSGRWPFRRM